MRDSFIFYRSFFESFSNLPKKDKLVLIDALCNYALNDIVPELTGTPAAVFNLLKPQVDANNRRYQNGCKGGRPKTNQDKTKTKPNDNLNITKPKPNVHDNDNDNVNVNVNVNVNDNVHDNDNDNAVGSVVVVAEDGKKYTDIWKSMTPMDVDAVFGIYPESGDDLIQAVYEDVKAKRKIVKQPVQYIIGYAKNVGWDDNAEHFDGQL